MKRRTFLQRLGHCSLGAAALPVLNPRRLDAVWQAVERVAHVDPKDLARDEDFWYAIQQAYTQSPHFINLESGYFSPSADAVLDGFIGNARMINQTPSFYMRRRQFPEKEEVRKQLAAFVGCSPEEIALTRNTTEALNIVIAGLQLADDDEFLYADQEYDSMLEVLEQRVLRYGLRRKIIALPLVPGSPDDIVQIYEDAITPNTRVILISHLTYLTGHLLPVRNVCDMAHERGIEVIVDAAHSLAHLDFKIADLNCDYLGSSLHKWLGAPLGTGMLYVKKEKIERVWPLFGDVARAADDIRKFEHIGTHPSSAEITIANAIHFHNGIGSKRKEERLRYLKNYWAEKVIRFPGVTLNTPLRDDQSCALANVAIAGKMPADVADYLYDTYKIFTVAIDTDAVQGVRIAPNLFTRLEDLDALVKGIKELAAG